MYLCSMGSRHIALLLHKVEGGGPKGRTNELTEAPDHVGEAERVDSIATRGKLVTDGTNVLWVLHIGPAL